MAEIIVDSLEIIYVANAQADKEAIAPCAFESGI
jgi:hypothetical protein